eukprot:m.297697 g.297697  ORF g.297697 m.297697 type:complete len:88 (-) comp20086_c0_seq3:747-1010(-)
MVSVASEQASQSHDAKSAVVVSAAPTVLQPAHEHLPALPVALSKPMYHASDPLESPTSLVPISNGHNWHEDGSRGERSSQSQFPTLS